MNVVGAGAIGGFLAAALARAGFEVGAVARGAHLQAIRRGGLRVRSELGTFTAAVPAADDLRALPPAEYVLLTFKAHQWTGVLEQLAPSIAAGATFVTLQNGVPFWFDPGHPIASVDPGGALLHAIPRAQIIGGVVHASGRIVEPGLVEQSGGVLYPIGELDGAQTPRLRALADAFTAAGLDAPQQDDIRARVWIKLLGNLALNPASALTRATVGTLLHDADVRALMRALVAEGIAVGRACGLTLAVTPEARLEMAEHVADVKTSMLQDLESGKLLELDPIAGAVVELAGRYGVEVPLTRALYALTRLRAEQR